MKVAVIGQFSTTVEAVRGLQKAGLDVDVFCLDSQMASFARYGIHHCVPNVITFDDINSSNTYAALQKSNPDAILSVIFGNKIPNHIIDLPTEGAFNFHPSQLPEFRSGNAWFWPIRMGMNHSALTIHRITEEWDSGNVVWEKQFPLTPQDTQGIYVERVNSLTEGFVEEFGTILQTRNLPERVQDSGLAKYYPKIKFKDIMIDWTESAESISNLVRACNPYHFAQTLIRSTVIEIAEASVTDRVSKEPGYITTEDDRLFIGTGTYDIEVKVIKFFEFGTFSAKRLMSLYPLESGHRAGNLALDPSVADILNQLLT